MLLCCLKDAQRVDLAEHCEAVTEGRSFEQDPGWRTPPSAECAEQGNEVFTIALLSESNLNQETEVKMTQEVLDKK